jgi:opacity protein-like surface antigen
MERQASGGLYVAIFGGVNVGQTADVEDNDAGIFGTIDTELDSDIGWFGGLKFGYACPVPSVIKPAIELEGFYMGINSTFTNESDFGDFDLNADFHSAVFMVNAKVQFDLGRFQPYLGAGLGYAHTWIDEVEVAGRKIEGAESDEGTFAYQGIAGFEVKMTERVGIFTEYKAVVLHDLGDVTNYVNHLVGAGVRIGF